jgi:dTDP-4-dehydrorhamnose reductase
MIVVIGANGQLGTELRKILGTDATYLTRAQIDLSDEEKLAQTVNELRPSFLINAAAYNAVDKAENETDLAFQINCHTPALLSRLSRENGFKFVTVSTDYVFDGESSKPYIETDPVNPLSVYGRSKAEGEKRVLDENPTSLIVRTSWVHSSHGKGFLNTVLRLAREKKPMKVVDDSIGSPTWAHDLAEVILKARDLSGVFHFSNEGLCSWYDFACAIRRFGNLDLSLTPVSSTEFPTPACRPKFSLLNKNKIKSSLGIQIPHWIESLEKCLKELS